MVNEVPSPPEVGEMVVKCQVVTIPVLPRLHVLEANRGLERGVVTPTGESLLLARNALLAIGL